MITPGNPAVLTPATRTPGALKLIMYQIDGAVGRRCGSFESNGLPVTVRFPLTTQLLLYASFSKDSRDTGAAFSCADVRLVCASLPTTSTSIGEISGNSSERFSAGK